MLILSDTVSKKAIMSVHAGKAIARIAEPIIEPSNLKIVAFSVSAPGLKFLSVLHSGDIREWSRLGVIVNSEDDIMEVDENMPKIRKLAEDNFQLGGVGVRTESGKRLGRVRNFVFETEGFFVVKFYVERFGLLGFTKPTLIFDRDSVVNITQKYIVIADDASRSVVGKKSPKDNLEYGFSTD